MLSLHTADYMYPKKLPDTQVLNAKNCETEAHICKIVYETYRLAHTNLVYATYKLAHTIANLVYELINLRTVRHYMCLLRNIAGLKGLYKHQTTTQ